MHDVLYEGCEQWVRDLSNVVVSYLPQPIGFVLWVGHGDTRTRYYSDSVVFDRRGLAATFLGKWGESASEADLLPTDGYVQLFPEHQIVSFPTPIKLVYAGRLFVCFRPFVMLGQPQGSAPPMSTPEGSVSAPKWLSEMDQDLPISITNGFPPDVLKRWCNTYSERYVDRGRNYLLKPTDLWTMRWTMGWWRGMNFRGMGNNLHDIAIDGSQPRTDCPKNCQACINTNWNEWPHS